MLGLISQLTFTTTLVLVLLGQSISYARDGVERKRGQQVATDLVFQGQALLPEEALRLNTDLSLIDPDPTTELWSPSEINSREQRQKQADLNLRSQIQTEFRFVSTSPSRNGNFRFVAQTLKGTESNSGFFVFWANRAVHNFLLRKALLRKLGYEVPASTHVAKLKIHFESKIEKEVFLNELRDKAAREFSRWIVENDENSTVLVLQDLIANDVAQFTYDLANDYIPESVSSGKRLLSSLLVPYSLVTSPESVNLFTWVNGRLEAGYWLPSYTETSQFNCSYDDARWAARKVLDLGADAFEDVVAQAALPVSVAKLTLEKILSRRNSLIRFLELDSEYRDLPVKIQIHYKNELVSGRLRQEEFPGYARRFKATDVQSPLSIPEIASFFGAKALSTVLNNVSGLIDAIPYVNHDYNDAAKIHEEQVIDQAISKYLETGEVQRPVRQAWALPTWGANVIVGRDIVAGTYMGTDNLIQVADSFGFAFNLGGAVGVDAISPYFVRGNANVAYQRIYSHLKPIKSVKAGLKTPFRNILVPWFMKKSLKGLSQLLDDPNTEESRKAVYDALEDLKKNIEVGESLMITDGLRPAIGVEAGVQTAEVVRLSAGVEGSVQVLHRIHLYRKSENEFQVYRSEGNVLGLDVSVGASVGIPLKEIYSPIGLTGDIGNLNIPMLRIGVNFAKGRALTKFHPMTLSTAEDVKILSLKLKAIHRVMMTESSESLNEVAKPFTIQHQFDENLEGLDVLVLNLRRLRNTSHITVTAPDGAKRELQRTQLAKTVGANWENVGARMLELPLEYLTRFPVSVASSPSNNPGYSFMGQARNRILVFESEIIDQNGTKQIQDNYLQSSIVWNGWVLGAKRLHKILDQIDRRTGQSMFERLDLSDTRKVFLYNLHLNTVYSQAAIDRVMNLNEHDLDSGFPHQHQRPLRQRLKFQLEKMKAAMKDANPKKLARIAMRFIQAAENNLDSVGMANLLGKDSDGGDLFFTFGQLEGYRVGSDTADKPYVSHVFGNLPDQRVMGISSHYAKKIGATEGEFLASWVLRRPL